MPQISINSKIILIKNKMQSMMVKLQETGAVNEEKVKAAALSF